jgi:hypothetical protein
MGDGQVQRRDHHRLFHNNRDVSTDGNGDQELSPETLCPASSNDSFSTLSVPIIIIAVYVVSSSRTQVTIRVYIANRIQVLNKHHV